jgi:hypothetical protein
LVVAEEVLCTTPAAVLGHSISRTACRSGRAHLAAVEKIVHRHNDLADGDRTVAIFIGGQTTRDWGRFEQNIDAARNLGD